MATIQTKLTSDNKQHDDAFRKSKQEVYNYQKKVDAGKNSLLSFAKGGIGKLIPMLGLATGAMGTFNQAMKTNDALGDKFNNNMAAAKAGVNAFLNALTTNRLDGFLSRLKDITAEAKRVAETLDSLGTMRTVYTAQMSKYEAELSGYRAKKSAGTLTEADKVEMNKIESAMRGLVQKMVDGTTAIQNKMLDKWIKESGAKQSRGGFLKHLMDVAMGNIDVDAQIEKNRGSWSNVAGSDTKYWNQSPQMKADFEYWTYLKSILDTDEFVQFFAIMTEGQNYLKRLNDDISKSNKISGGGGSNTPKAGDVFSESDWLRHLEGSIEYSRENPQGLIGDVVFGDMTASDAEHLFYMASTGLKTINTDLDNSASAARNAYQEFSKLIDNLTNAGGVIGSFANAFSALGDATDNDAFKGIGIIGQAISTMLLSYAEATAQASKMGPVAWAIFAATGIAQVATVISQMKSLGQYAEGGIVGGNSYSGDRVLARVNSGEMILNGSQQAQLFNMINSGGLGGNVVFRISGSDLVGTLNNYNNKNRRVR